LAARAATRGEAPPRGNPLICYNSAVKSSTSTAPASDRHTTMNFEQARFNMIEQQIRTWDVLDRDVLSLLTIVKRENFVPTVYRNLAFSDLEIPLPQGQRMLSPKVEARVLQELAVKKYETVLEIGTGSGYMAALLAHGTRSVLSVEIVPELAEFARRNLSAHGVSNVEVVEGDGSRGWADAGPYDVICVSGGLPILPQELLEQLKVGGRLAVFVGTAPVMEAQIITRFSEQEYRIADVFETYVEPLINAVEPPRFKF
jgi:protein-L-isoaspartate(D-aspartate) O-methyltransferase